MRVITYPPYCLEIESSYILCENHRAEYYGCIHCTERHVCVDHQERIEECQ